MPQRKDYAAYLCIVKRQKSAQGWDRPLLYEIHDLIRSPYADNKKWKILNLYHRKYIISACISPPDVAFDTAHAASFWISNSEDCSSEISFGNTPAFITDWICAEVPARK